MRKNVKVLFLLALVFLCCTQNSSFGYRILDEDDQVFMKKEPLKQDAGTDVLTKRISKAGRSDLDTIDGSVPSKKGTNRDPVSTGDTKPSIGSGVSITRLQNIDFRIGFYGGVGVSFGFLNASTNISALLRVGMDFRLNSFYWALEVFGNLGAEAGVISNHEFIVGGSLKFGAAFGLGKWSSYLILSPQYEDLAAYDGKYFSIGFGCGFKVRVLPFMSVFLEQRVMFKAASFGEGIVNERPFVVPYIAVGLDFYI